MMIFVMIRSLARENCPGSFKEGGSLPSCMVKNEALGVSVHSVNLRFLALLFGAASHDFLWSNMQCWP